MSPEHPVIQPRPSDLGLGEDIDAIGLNLAGVVPISEYDRSVPAAWTASRLLPTARSAIVLAAGGDELFRRHRAAGTSLSLDDFVGRALDQACARLSQSGCQSLAFGYDEKRDDQFLDLIGVAVLSGIGGYSRLGLLVHPEYGPWLSLRALVLTEGRFRERSTESQLEPCAGCPAPCLDACPAGAPRPRSAGFDIDACAAQRALPGRCQLQCDARRACVLGGEHAYAPEAEQAFMAPSLSEILGESD